MWRLASYPGHDGRLGNELVEVKTITPHKVRSFVRVKWRCNFSVLAVVRVDEHHRFDARLIRRSQFVKEGDGKYVTLSWSTACKLAESENGQVVAKQANGDITPFTIR